MNRLDPQPGPSNQEDVQGATPAKRAKFKTFLKSWFSIPEFAGWLQAVENDPRKAFCTCCQKTIACGKSELKKHAARDSHIHKVALLQSEALETRVIAPQVDEQEIAHKAVVKCAEIKLSAFYAEHNIGIATVNHLVPVLKSCFKDSRTAQDLSLGRTKCSKIITNCLGVRELEKLVEILKFQKFSVLVDESTDISDVKTLCVLVQFVSPHTKLVVTELLELVELDARNSSAENIYAAFKSCLELKGIPITNVVGMASDNASVMLGTNNSFMTRLRSDTPNLVVLNCICHSSALIASKACAEFPRSCEDLIRSIATYVSGSAKRSAVLREFQEL